MPPKPLGSQQDPPSYQFITDPSYDETLSGRVRAACINCSRRKVKCSGRIPCETCVSQNKTCEGLKKPTRWEKRRKRAPVVIPLNVRGSSADQNRTDDSSSQTETGQQTGRGESRRGNQSRRLSETNETFQTHPNLPGYSDNFPPYPYAPPLEFGQAEYGANISLDRPATARSLPTSPFNQSIYSDHAYAPGFMTQQTANWQIDPATSTQSTPSLPTPGQRPSPFILAAESLEHQARMLRLMDRRHNSVDSGYLNSLRHSVDATTTDAIFGVSHANMAMNDEGTVGYPSLNQVATASGNMVAPNPRNMQQWPPNWQQDGPF